MELFELLLAAVGGAFVSGLSQFIISGRKNRKELEMQKDANLHERQMLEEEQKTQNDNHQNELKGELLKLVYSLETCCLINKSYFAALDAS